MKIHINRKTAETFVFPFIPPDSPHNEATTALRVYQATITPLNLEQMNLEDSSAFQDAFATALAICKEQQRIADNPPADMDAMAIANGFESAQDFFKLVSKVPLNQAFLNWRDKDGTKAGLLKLLG